MLVYYIIIQYIILYHVVVLHISILNFLQRDESARQLENCQTALTGIKKEAKDIEETWGSKVSTLTADR